MLRAPGVILEAVWLTCSVIRPKDVKLLGSTRAPLAILGSLQGHIGQCWGWFVVPMFEPGSWSLTTSLSVVLIINRILKQPEGVSYTELLLRY